MIRFFKYIIPLTAILFSSLSCETGKKYDVLFSYRSIIDKEYRFNVGRVIPVTISQSIETDGDLSADGNFFFYSSNREGGNYDIYLRSLNDITTVRLTSHPSKDISPVISPDGKNLAFVSYRTDPEGDIFILKLKPEELIAKAESSIKGLEALDREAVNISLQKNKYGVVVNRKDAFPVWSPDGKRIAFSSASRTGSSIWTMKPDGSGRKLLTPKGGDYPAYSSDGRKILFVSYRDKRNGELYSVDTATGKETRLTDSSDIKLYPSYAGSSRIIYSSIGKDTNGNGRLDLQDRSVLMSLNTSTGESHSLTSSSVSSFKAKWLPVLKTRDYNGVIVYTDITGENINLNIIPEKGIIPAKNNARLQHQLCETYIEEYDDPERHIMALEAVYFNFGSRKDRSSVVYVDRALHDAALFYFMNNRKKEAGRMMSFLKKRAEGNDSYARSVIALLGRRGLKTPSLKKSSRSGNEKNRQYFEPFMLEDRGDHLSGTGRDTEAAEIYSAILDKYPKFERVREIRTKYALSKDSLLNRALSEQAVEVLTRGRTNQKISLTKKLVSPYTSKKTDARRLRQFLANSAALKKKYKDSKKVMAILHFAEGSARDRLRDREGARRELKESIKLSHPNDLAYYLANIRLGEIERENRNLKEAEKFFHTGINRYSRRFQTENFREKIMWLIEYYEKTGETGEAAGRFKEAALTYEKYINLLTLMYNKKLYSEVYNEYAPRAHVLYVNAYTSWKGDKGIAELEQSYRKKLPVYRMDFNKAAIYGLAYIYTLKADSIYSSLNADNRYSGFKNVIENFKMADEQIEWALFIDDTFIEPYLLKSWIYQFIDLERKNTGGENDSLIAEYFQDRLWEKNIEILEKAVNANDESRYPENEGNINLNMANNYFLLYNYPRALKHYREAEKYKRKFSSDIEKALFHFHLGYCCWQNDDTLKAKEEIEKAHNIYRNISGQEEKLYSSQFLIFYKYYALFNRYEKKYDQAIEWYRKILDYSEKYRLPVDRARYMQEIAYCYKETNRLDSARAYIRQAEMLLKKYPSDERKYYLRIKLFGIGPFPIFNMGPDTAVIGGNRIFHPLDRESKKMFNISMLEDISLLNNDYSSAIKNLKKKISLIKKSSTSLSTETEIRSLNNIGFYYFRSGNFNEAENYFIKARKLSVEKENLQGMFTSIMNLTNLYALMIENKMDSSRDWESQAGRLIQEIEKYRNSYSETKYRQAEEELKETAKLKKRKVAPRELAELKSRIDMETSRVYYSLDIALGIIKFHRAELSWNRTFAPAGSRIRNSKEFLDRNSSIYRDYSEALKRFVNAYNVAEENGNRHLMAKLLLNSAKCHLRLGDSEKAYVSLIDAGEIAEKYGYTWLRIESAFRTGSFMKLQGKKVEGPGYLGRSENLFKSAASLIEKNPLLYTPRMQRIESFYNEYTSLLIEMKKYTEALKISERGSKIKRMMLISSISPAFRNDYDSSAYYSCLGAVKNLREADSRFSAVLEKGSAPDSPDFLNASSEQKKAEQILNRSIAEAGRTNPLLLSYLQAGRTEIPDSPFRILKFFEKGSETVCWDISDRRVSRHTVSGDEKIKQLSSIAGKGNPAQPLFIIINREALEIMSSAGWAPGRDCILIPGLDRVSEYLKNQNRPLPSVYSEVKGLSAEGTKLPVSVTGEGGIEAMKKSSLVIDRAGEGIDITSGVLFSEKGLSPSCIISISKNRDPDSLIKLSESALYGGTKSIIIAEDENALAGILKKIYSPAEKDEPADFMAAGYIHSLKPAPDNKRASLEIKKFKEAMLQCSYEQAATYLSRWNIMQPAENSPEYLKNMWLINILSGKTDAASETAEKLAPENSRQELTKKAMQIYILMRRGQFGQASQLYEAGKSWNTYRDSKFIEALLAFSKSGEGEAFRIAETADIKKPQLIPSERYLMLLAQYISAFDIGKASELAGMAGTSSMLSPGEHLLMQILAGRKAPSGISERFDSMASIWTMNGSSPELKDSTGKSMGAEEGYDMLSVYPLILLAARYDMSDDPEEMISFLSTVDLQQLTAAADLPSSLFLLFYLDRQMENNGLYSKREKIHNLTGSALSGKIIPRMERDFLYQKAMNLTLIEKYSDAFDAAQKAEKITGPENRSYVPLQLLLMNLYIKSQRFKEAADKAGIIEGTKGLKPHQYYMLNLQKSLIELNRLSGLKKATSRDAAEFERLFIKSVNLLKSNISILNSQGVSEITDRIFDQFINYKFRTGQHQDAHYYSELKKLALISSATGQNLIASAGAIDTAALQQSIPEDTVYINIARNRDDLLVWALDRKRRTAFAVEGGFSRALAVTEAFESSGVSSRNYVSARKELGRALAPVLALTSGKKSVILCPDSNTEKIRFELAGTGRFLAEKVSLFYITSPLFTGSRPSALPPGLTMTGRDNSVLSRLEEVAAAESGIEPRYRETAAGGAVHILGNIKYSRRGRTFLVNSRPYSASLKRAGFIYARSASFSKSGLNNFIGFNRKLGVSAVLLNGSDIQDTNNAVFAEYFYRELRHSRSVTGAYRKSLDRIRQSRKFSGPAYWSGMRLYLSSLNTRDL